METKPFVLQMLSTLDDFSTRDGCAAGLPGCIELFCSQENVTWLGSLAFKDLKSWHVSGVFLSGLQLMAM
jgi:hypothetical protein